MPNANTPHSRALRAATATRRNQAATTNGGKRVTVILPPDTAQDLEQLTVIYGSQTAAIIAALTSLKQAS